MSLRRGRVERFEERLTDLERRVDHLEGRMYAVDGRVHRRADTLQPRPKGPWYPFEAPSKQRIQEVAALDPLLGGFEALERKMAIYFRWVFGIEFFKLVVTAVLA